jgi:hypothetical protein
MTLKDMSMGTVIGLLISSSQLVEAVFISTVYGDLILYTSLGSERLSNDKILENKLLQTVARKKEIEM